MKQHSELSRKYPLTELFLECMTRSAKLEGALTAFVEQVFFLLDGVEKRVVTNEEVSQVRNALEKALDELDPGADVRGAVERGGPDTDREQPGGGHQQQRVPADGFSRPRSKRW